MPIIMAYQILDIFGNQKSRTVCMHQPHNLKKQVSPTCRVAKPKPVAGNRKCLTGEPEKISVSFRDISRCDRDIFQQFPAHNSPVFFPEKSGNTKKPLSADLLFRGKNVNYKVLFFHPHD